MEHVSHGVRIIATRVLCLACLAGGLATGHVQAESPGQPQKDEEMSLLRISAARSISGTGLIGFLAARFGADVFTSPPEAPHVVDASRGP